MATTRRAQQPSPRVPPSAVAVVGGLLALAATVVLGPPGPVIALAAGVIAGALSRPPELTGRKDTFNRPTPATDDEARRVLAHGVWRALPTSLLALGGAGIVPTRRVRLSWLGAVGAGLFALQLPSPWVWPTWARVLGALAAFALVTGIDQAWRSMRHPDDPCPGVTAADVVASSRPLTWAATVLGALLAGAGALAFLAWRQGVAPGAAPAVLGAVLAGASAGADLSARASVLTPWRDTIEARARWEARWKALKTDPAPRLVSHERPTDTLHVDTFEASPAIGGAGAFIGAKPAAQIATALGAGTASAPTEVPDVDQQGQPQPGTIHPTRFKVVSFTDGAVPDIAAPDADPAVVGVCLEYAMARFCDMYSYRHPLFLGAERVSVEDGPAVWAVSWAPTPISVDFALMRSQGSGAMEGDLGCAVVTDAREQVMFAGDLWDEEVAFTDAVPQPMRGSRPRWPSVHDYLGTLRDEAAWDFRWAQSLKQSIPAPRPDFSVKATDTLSGGQSIDFLPFVMKQGITPDDYYGVAPKLATTLSSAPFCAVTSFPLGRPEEGNRHPQAISVMWSAKAVPTSPRTLAPKAQRAGKAETWVLTDLVERAFVAARLPRPQVCSVRPLTKAGGREHIWALTLRLYDGATLEAVRAAQTKLASALAVPWLRVARGAKEGFVDLYAGARPKDAPIAQGRDEKLVASLDWEQAWADAGILGAGGLVPTLTAVDRLPHNTKVQVLDFDLPSPINVPRIRMGVEKLKSATGNLFIDVRQGLGGASSARILACPTDPMPVRAGYDFMVIDTLAEQGKGRIAFATGVDGEPVAWDTRTSAHALVAGASGGGKGAPLWQPIPVPVSERFPTGWATVGTLEVGDLVFAATGVPTRVVGLSEIFERPLCRVHLSDGQVIECNPEHLWKATSARIRDTHAPRASVRTARANAALASRAACVRRAAARVGAGQMATLPTIARVAGYHPLSLHNMGLSIDELATRALIPTGRHARAFSTEDVARHVDRAGGATVCGVQLSGRGIRDTFHGEYVSARAFSEALTGRTSTRDERYAASRLAMRAAARCRAGSAMQLATVYPVDEVLELLAESIEGRVRETPAEVVVSTADIAATIHRASPSRTQRNWAVRVPGALELPHVPVPVPPYTLGAWLGDGSSRRGDITTADPEILSEIRADGYEVSAHADPLTHGILGLQAQLRAAGVLTDKRIPALYQRASKEQRMALLQGLMDTDGYVAEDGGCEIALCKRDLAVDTLELVRGLGIKASMTSGPAALTEPDPAEPGGTRRRIVGTRHRIKFTTTARVFRLPRKASRLPASVRPTQSRLYVTDVEVSESVPMRCLKVEDPEHLYLAGGFVPTHNSVLMQSIVAGAVASGWGLVVVDPSKGAADFRFARPYANAVAVTISEAQGALDLAYREVVRRKDANASHGVGSFRDLPVDARPAPMLIAIDEFTSLITQEKVGRPSDDIEVENERQKVVADNNARARIGTVVGRIAREARSAGVVLVLGTQRLSAQILDGVPGGSDLRSNLARILLGKATYGDKQAALRQPDAAPDLGEIIPPGRGIWEPSDGSSLIIQSWYDPGEQDFLTGELARRREPLPDALRWDLSPYTQAEAVPSVREITEDEVVVDLGEERITWEDLGAPASEPAPAPVDDAADLDEVDDEPVPDWDVEEVGAEAVEPDPSKVLLLEAEGALLPEGSVDPDPGVCARLAGLGVRIVWAADTGQDANEEFAPCLGGGDLPVLPETSRELGWWKLDALAALLREDPQVGLVAWADAGLGGADALGVPFADTAGDIAADAGVPFLAVVPDADTGLTEEDLDRIEAFFEETPLVPQPADRTEAVPPPRPRPEPEFEPQPEPQPPAPNPPARPEPPARRTAVRPRTRAQRAKALWDDAD